MIRYKELSIPTPCSVDYESLPYDEVKRFCGSCKQYVYDFRGKNEAYLNEIFRTTGKVCGVYYEDQIQKPSLKMQRPFYYAFVTKAISFGLFFKTIFNIYESSAAVKEIPQTTQKSIDTAEVKVHYDEKRVHHRSHRINVYVNEQLFEYELKEGDTILYLPDHIQPNDKIKILVLKSKIKINNSVLKTKAREYSFTYQDAESITIEISCKRNLLLLKRKRKYYSGRTNRSFK